MSSSDRELRMPVGLSRAAKTPILTREPDPSLYCDDDERVSQMDDVKCTTPWTYSRYRGVPSSDYPDVYARLCTLVKTLYSHGVLVHGGVLRDSVVGVLPGDIDIVIRASRRMSVLSLLRKGYHIEVSRINPGGFGSMRYLIHMEPKTIVSDATMFVIDMRVVREEITPLHLLLPPDWDVCSLYLCADDTRNNTLRTPLGNAVSNYSHIDYDALAVSLHERRATIPLCASQCTSEIGEYVDYHHRCTLADRAAREAALSIAGFTDETVYNCTKYECRRAPAGVVCHHATTIVLQICAANIDNYRKDVTNRVRFATVAATAIARDAISRICEIPQYEWLLATVKPDHVVAVSAPRIPPLMYPRTLHTISDAAHELSLAASGHVVDLEEVLRITQKYRTTAKESIMYALGSFA